MKRIKKVLKEVLKVIFLVIFVSVIVFGIFFLCIKISTEKLLDDWGIPAQLSQASTNGEEMNSSETNY